MGLIDLKTDLKSLRYGKDTIGGGYSGQPYIQTPIPDSFNDLGANEDFILRGGINAARDTANDIKRLTKMFFDLKSPNGVLFIAKQNLLSQTSVRTQTTNDVNEGIYTPLNTLAQVGVVNTGGHLNKQGLNPFAETGAYSNNDALYSVKVKPTQLVENNRLARLYQLISTNASDKLDGFILNNGPQNVLTYTGGPNAVLGVGKTNIRYSSFRTGKQNPQYVNDPDFFNGNNNQRSVNIDDKQVGGLQVEAGDGTKPWIKGGIVFDAGGNFYIDELPSFNINSPQSNSLSNINYGPSTWTSKQNISASGYVNGQFPFYTPYNVGILKKIETFNAPGLIDPNLTNDLRFITNKGFNISGDRLLNSNVYNPGSLDPYGPIVTGSLSQKIQKSVNADNISVGGLKVEPEKTWIKSPNYGLPNNNLNSPQSGSLNNTWYTGEKTWKPKQNVTNPNGGLEANYSSQINNRNTNPNSGSVYIGGVSNKYFKLIKRPLPNSKYVTDGNLFKPNWNSNVYTQGNTFPENSPVIYNNQTTTYTQQDIINTENNDGKLKGSPKIYDFRKVLREKLKNTEQGKTANKTGATPNTPNYANNNIGKKTQIGNPGQRSGNSYVSYTRGVSYSGDIKALDKINASPIGTSINDSEGGSNNDLVTFNITPFGGSETLNFRAFLGSFTDNFSGKLNSQQYVGRGEEFYTYTGFTRKISLSWTVAALSKQELIPMYKKLSYLASNTAPVYKDGFMQGPLVTLTVGGYIYNMPGYIEGLTLEMGEDSTWEIGINDNGGRDTTVAQLTHIIKVNGFNFTPIPTYLPQRGAHFIDLWNGSSNLWSDNATSLT